jgi:predicted porin
MKKTLVALAVLAASGASMAQSSVTLYGRLDVGLASTKTEKTGAAPVASLTQVGINSSDINSTFWGLKGVEDLGGGLKAIFKLESRFQVDTGALAAAGSTGPANTAFEREANVGIEGGFGSLKLGRNPTVYDDLQGTVNAVFNSNFRTAQDVAAGTGVPDYLGTVNNSIKFNSATYGGFSGAVQYAFGENKETVAATTVNSLAVNNAVGDTTDAWGLSLKYAAGPLAVVYGHQEEKQAQAVATTAQDTRKFDLLGGSYDFGVAKLVGDYATAKNNARSDKTYQLGVSVPMGAFTLAAGYTDEKSTGDNVPDLSSKGYSVVGTYDMSKRTTLYAGLEDTKTEAATGASAATITESKRTNMVAGIRHLF